MPVIDSWLNDDPVPVQAAGPRSQFLLGGQTYALPVEQVARFAP